MTNIKIVRKGTEPEVYDVYFDVGLFSPLIKKWKIDKSALTREEVIKYIAPWLLDIAGSNIYVVISSGPLKRQKKYQTRWLNI